MSALIIKKLPYHRDSVELFECFRDMKLPVFLDSAAPYSDKGRYDILSAAPVTIIKHNHHCDSKKPINFFEEIKTALANTLSPVSNPTDLPFCGGIIGYFSYDLGRQIEQLPTITTVDIPIPDGVVGIYSWAIIVDHHKQQSYWVIHPDCTKDLIEKVQERLYKSKLTVRGSFSLSSDFQSNLKDKAYQQAFDAIQSYILDGDCYQINLSQRFVAKYQGDPWSAYLKLRKTAAAPFSSYMEVDGNALLCLSPERFLKLKNGQVITSPIKGTINRGKNEQEDQRLAEQLTTSTKDRAENLMIVDLLRNDISKNCVTGSVAVKNLFQLQSFETVHHLVSTVTGELKADLQAVDLLSGCFPGGSITGAPKIRAMEIIEELEPCRRSVYCGSIGYISCDGQMDTNITIRTLLCHGGSIYCWAGGGIVADSNCDSEYQECLNKVGKLLQALRDL